MPGLHCSVQDLLVVAHGINFPTRGWNPGLLHRECGVCYWTTKEVPVSTFKFSCPLRCHRYQWAPQTYKVLNQNLCFLLLALLLAQWITKENLGLLRACRDLGDRWRLVASQGESLSARRTNTFKILSWPKRLFGLFHMLWKNPDEVLTNPMSAESIYDRFTHHET